MLWGDHKFPTASGHIEIASAAAASDGHPRTPVPVLLDKESPVNPNDGKLFRLLTPADEWHMNHSYDNEPRIRERTDPATITIHPTDASALGLRTGDAAAVWNDAGCLTLNVTVDDKTLPGVCWAPKGRWPYFADDKHNVNVLNPGLISDMGESTALHGVNVHIRPV